MKSSDVIAVALVAIVLFFLCLCFSVLGFHDGKNKGANQACQSVKLEWVVDKCMKVTREAV